ncbi:unnamed protein product [Notodromas monacha]|uniref:Uncharacterized protein n=1 Tax=Notodromas monacha TaxID=399045 RepID=A0A7R9GI68_9CRUS|nr:unnamed protein product [Notodromas monacha]CAG0923636.1 unnamed protein product [Notodromas monacha]
MVSLGPDPEADVVVSERALMTMLDTGRTQSVKSFKGSTRSAATSIAESHGRGRREFRDMRRGSEGALMAAAGSILVATSAVRSKSSGRRPSEYSRGSGYGDRAMSEARSYDETTVRNMTRHPESYYSTSRPQSTQFFSEDGRTMAEREDGSSVWIPQSRLYRLAPDSDLGSETSSRTRDMRSSKISSSPPH